LDAKHIKRVEVTLDVGLGTFAEVEDINVTKKYLHSEKIKLSQDTVVAIQGAKRTQTPVIAVGTTVVRTLESQSSMLLTSEAKDIVTETNIFIMDGYKFEIVDHLITNFHVPKSSLMALVSAFLTHKKSKRALKHDSYY
jgi:S-adenosylmethionine:tRNA ribosyltransferase-isomerase